jgi:hypothetical protein
VFRTSPRNLGHDEPMIHLEIIHWALVHDFDPDLMVKPLLATIEIVASVSF